MSCPHGMPTPASCVDCMDEGPVVEMHREKLKAEHWIVARFDSQCAEGGCPVAEGDRVGIVEGVGWCCEKCAA